MYPPEPEQTPVNDSGTPARSDTDLTPRRSGPVRFELMDREAGTVANFTTVRALREAVLKIPDQQDPERSGAGWDVQAVRS